MTHVKALQAGHSSQWTSEPITPGWGRSARKIQVVSCLLRLIQVVYHLRTFVEYSHYDLIIECRICTIWKNWSLKFEFAYLRQLWMFLFQIWQIFACLYANWVVRYGQKCGVHTFVLDTLYIEGITYDVKPIFLMSGPLIFGYKTNKNSSTYSKLCTC